MLYLIFYRVLHENCFSNHRLRGMRKFSWKHVKN